MAATDRICDRCDERILESERRHVDEDGELWCGSCLKKRNCVINDTPAPSDYCLCEPCVAARGPA